MNIYILLYIYKDTFNTLMQRQDGGQFAYTTQNLFSLMKCLNFKNDFIAIFSPNNLPSNYINLGYFTLAAMFPHISARVWGRR